MRGFRPIRAAKVDLGGEGELRGEEALERLAESVEDVEERPASRGGVRRGGARVEGLDLGKLAQGGAAGGPREVSGRGGRAALGGGPGWGRPRAGLGRGARRGREG